MTNIIISLIFAAVALIIAYRTYSLIVESPHRLLTESIDLPAGIPMSYIGNIEGQLPNLKSVLVVADKVSRPTASLADAVESNFARGVKYTFLVSNDRADEISGYYMIFEAYAGIASARKKSGQAADLLDIQRLPYHWDDYPYIFYTIMLASGQEKTLAFRGDQLHKGIADHYGRVDPVLAHTIAQAIKSEAPRSLRDLQVERTQFEETSNIIEINNSRMQKVAK